MINLPDNTYCGMPILFKNGYGWQSGKLFRADLNNNLTFSVLDNNEHQIDNISCENIFFHAHRLEDWEYDYLYDKEEFLERYQDEEFTPITHSAFVSDGVYVYYRVDKWNKNWLDKQPFEYVYCR